MKPHLTGWHLSAGDEHEVRDHRRQRIVNVQCGGMTGRRFDEATDIARLIVAAPELVAQLEWAESVLKCFIEGSAQLDDLRATLAKARLAA